MKEQNLLLLGPEEGDKAERFEAERKALLSACPELETETYYANDNCEKEAIASLRQPSLFASTRLIVIKYFESVKKGSSFQKALSEYISSPEKGVYLVMLSSDTSSPFDKGHKNLETVVFYEDYDNNKVRWIRNAFQKNGFKVSDDGIEEILGSVENNKADMKSMIDSISSYYKTKGMNGQVLSSEEISSVVSREKGETGYSLFSAIAERNLEKALLVLSAINLQDPRGLVAAATILSGEFRLLEDAALKRKAGKSDDEIWKEASGLQTGPFVFKGISFKKRAAMQNGMRRYSLDEIHEIVRYLAASDTTLKTQGGESFPLFQTIVYNIVVNGGEKKNLASLYPGGLEIKLM